MAMTELEKILAYGQMAVNALDKLEGAPDESNAAVQKLTDFVNLYASAETEDGTIVGMHFKPGEIPDLPDKVKHIISAVQGPLMLDEFPMNIQTSYEKWPAELSYFVTVPNVEKLGEKYKVMLDAPQGHKENMTNFRSINKGDVPEAVAQEFVSDITELISDAHAKSSSETVFKSDEFKRVLNEIYVTGRNSESGRGLFKHMYMQKLANYSKDHKDELKAYVIGIAKGLKTAVGDTYEKFKDITQTLTSIGQEIAEYNKRSAEREE